MEKKGKTALMDEKLYHELGQLTNDKTLWKQNIPYAASLLEKQSPKITAKAMWLLGEMGLMYAKNSPVRLCRHLPRYIRLGWKIAKGFTCIYASRATS